jgi:hypothetical protein
LGRSHYVNGKFIASDLCLVLTKKERSKYIINMEFYNIYLKAIREKLVSDLADGTSKLTINKKMLEEYFVEYVPIDVQNKYVEDHLPKYLEIRKQLEDAEKLLEEGIKKIL